MTVATNTTPGLASRLINGILAIKPLADFAKYKAREMMIKRAEKIGVPWRQEYTQLRSRNWDGEMAQVQNKNLVYPDYYFRAFHAYEKGNLSWDAAAEFEVAARAVHAGIWPDAGAQGDARLRETYHAVLKETLVEKPRDIVDLGCSIGMSTFALQDLYPQANLTGVDLSPHFLSLALYRSQQQKRTIQWVHAAAEATGLPSASYDLVSIFLVCHELPQSATQEIFAEVRRLLRPNGHIAIMDMNPQSQAYVKMPPYVLTLLKSTEPYMDQYFSLDISQTLVNAGFETPTITCNSPRHRTVIAKVR